MSEFLHIIKGTPLYVWFILVYLLFVGINSLKQNIVYLPKLFIIPFVLLAIKYKAFLSGEAVVFFLVIAMASLGSFFIHANNKVEIVKNSQSVQVPGSYSTLIILLSFFFVKYYFGYLKSADPDLALKYSFIENIISGLFSGYLIGRAIRYTYQYFKS